MDECLHELERVNRDLFCEPIHPRPKHKESKEEDKYFWERFIRRLVLSGFGDYETAANADLVRAAVFLYLASDKKARVRAFLDS